MTGDLLHTHRARRGQPAGKHAHWHSHAKVKGHGHYHRIGTPGITHTKGGPKTHHREDLVVFERIPPATTPKPCPECRGKTGWSEGYDTYMWHWCLTCGGSGLAPA